VRTALDSNLMRQALANPAISAAVANPAFLNQVFANDAVSSALAAKMETSSAN